MQLTSYLVSIVGWRDVCVINSSFHTNGLPEVIDLVKTKLAVQVEEDYSIPYREVRMCLQVPDIKKVLIVQ